MGGRKSRGKIWAEQGMFQRFLYVLDFEGDGLEFFREELTRIDRYRLANPIQIRTGKERGFVDVAMKSEIGLMPLDEVPNRTAPSGSSSLDPIEVRSIRRGMHQIDGLLWKLRFGEDFQILLDSPSTFQVKMRVDGLQFVPLRGGSNIRGMFLRRPGRAFVIPLFVIFRPEGGGRDKRVSDKFVPVI